MYENDYMYAIERNGQYLAHYGIKGMKWGVRKAIADGNGRSLSRQYRKASKKLLKLEKRAANGKKYARRAALLGAGAAAAGGLAAGGTQAIGRLGNALTRAGGGGTTRLHRVNGKLIKTKINPNALQAAGSALRDVERWGRSNSIGNSASKYLSDVANRAGKAATRTNAINNFERAAQGTIASGAKKASVAAKGISNNTIARIGAGAVGAGLLGGAAYNTYRAATTKRAGRKAAQFRAEMNKAFAGTQYAGKAPQYVPKQRKRRRG